jgi:hypothetical protein
MVMGLGFLFRGMVPGNMVVVERGKIHQFNSRVSSQRSSPSRTLVKEYGITMATSPLLKKTDVDVPDVIRSMTEIQEVENHPKTTQDRSKTTQEPRTTVESP